MVIAEAKAPNTAAAENSVSSLEFMAFDRNLTVDAKTKGFFRRQKQRLSEILAGTVFYIRPKLDL